MLRFSGNSNSLDIYEKIHPFTSRAVDNLKIAKGNFLFDNFLFVFSYRLIDNRGEGGGYNKEEEESGSDEIEEEEEDEESDGENVEDQQVSIIVRHSHSLAPLWEYIDIASHYYRSDGFGAKCNVVICSKLLPLLEPRFLKKKRG